MYKNYSNDKSVFSILISGTITLYGSFLHGSNYTFLARVELQGENVDAVYKPAKGEQPLWDFPARSLAKREAAAYLVDHFLGWDLVPPTVYRQAKAPLGRGSLQLYFRHDPLVHYFNLPATYREKLLRVAVFDVLANNADRKGGHILIDDRGWLRCIDHGLCFHEQDKLRTVVWDFSGQPVPAELLEDVFRMEAALAAEGSLRAQLTGLLSAAEIGALRRRCRDLLANPNLPVFDTRRRMVPYPPL